MNRDDQDNESYDGDLFADAMAAYKEVSGKEPTPEAAPAPTETAAPAADAPQQDEPERADADKSIVRDPKGRFAGKSERTTDKPSEKTDAPTAQPAAAGAKPAAVDKPDQATAQPVAGGPPPSWSIKAKAVWEKLPDDVRNDVLKREGEVAQGLAALRDYKDLKPFKDLADKGGTTIAAALGNYVKMEGLLRQNIGQGLAQITQNFGLRQDQAAELFARLAQHMSGGRLQVGGAQPNGGQSAPSGGQADPLVEAMRPLLGPLMKEIDGLKGQLSSREQADRNAGAQSLAKAIEKFGSDPKNRFFPDLEENITQLFETGMVRLTGNHDVDLQTAYDMAARMHPQVHEALIEQRLEEKRAADRKREQEAADKARTASRSITGSRVPGTRIVEQQEGKPGGFDDIEDDVRRAFRMHANS